MSKIKNDHIVLEPGNEIRFPTSTNKIYEDTTTGDLIITGYSSGTSGSSISELGELTDVVLTDLQQGDLLTYDTTSLNWINTSGTSGSSIPNLGELTDVVLTDLQQGDFLIYDTTSATWINTGDRVGGGTALIAGGTNAGQTGYYNIIDYVAISTLSNATDFGDLTRGRHGAAPMDNGHNDRGVFAGGGHSTASNGNIIDYVTISTIGDAHDFGDLIPGTSWAGGTSNDTNERGITVGGTVDGGSGYTNSIRYITITTTSDSSDFGDLSNDKFGMGATSNGTNERGVFGGGYDGGSTLNVLEYVTINSFSDAADWGDLLVATNGTVALSNGINQRGVWGGGFGAAANVLQYITISSTGYAQDFGDLTVGRGWIASASNATEERGIYAGGSDVINVIDYITINSLGNATDFGDLTLARKMAAGVSNGSGFSTTGAVSSGTSGSSGTSAAGANLDDLADVSASSPSDGDILVYDSTAVAWISIAYDTAITDLNLLTLTVTDHLVVPTTAPDNPVAGSFWITP